MKPSPGPWNTMAGAPWNLLDHTGCRIAIFNSNDLRSDSTPEDEANAAFTLELRDRLAEVYRTFFIGDPEDLSPEEYRQVEERMRLTLAKAGVLK